MSRTSSAPRSARWDERLRLRWPKRGRAAAAFVALLCLAVTADALLHLQPNQLWPIVALGAAAAAGLLWWSYSRRPETMRPAAELEREQGRMADFAEASSDWFWESDPDGNLTFLSEAFEGMTGVPVRKRIGALRLDLDRSVDAANPGWDAHLAAVAARQPFRDFEMTIPFASGTKHISVSGKPVFAADGRFVGYRGTTRDVTARIDAEHRLAAQSEALSVLIENLPVGVSLVGPDMRYRAFNAPYSDMFGIPPGFVKPGDHIEKVVRFIAERGDYGPGEVNALVRHHIARLSSGRPEVREQTRADGQIVEVRRVPLPDGGYVSTRLDITEVRRRERDLQAAQVLLEHQNQVFSTLIENLPVAVSLVGPDLNFTAFNQHFVRLFDLPPDFRPGVPFAELARHNARHGEYGPGDIETLVRERMAAATDPARREFERRRPNGQVIDFRRMPLPGGGFVTTYIDVTNAREREAALEQTRSRLEQQTKELMAAAEKLNAANAAKSQFLANMSHELRTPLNAILGFSEAMREQVFGELPAKYRTYAGDIHASGSHLLRLINDVLDLSRIEAGKLKLNEEEVDLVDVAAECQRLVFGHAVQGSIKLETDVSPALPRIVADRLRLKQVLLNLLSNAVKFTPPGGRVRLAGADLGQRGIEVTVADTGIGMDPRDVPRALQPFQQIDSRLTRRFEGAGLGLPLSKTFVEMHGGTLEIMTAPARGTTVRITLPAARAVAAR